MKIYVEGGGDGKDLKAKCRRGFSEFIRKSGLDKRMPSIVACGGRDAAFDDFCMALANGEDALLLVDSEDVVQTAHQSGTDRTKWQPWSHLKVRDGWDVSLALQKLAKRHNLSVPRVSDLHAHLMVCCTESWFVADPESLAKFYGQGFAGKQLSSLSSSVEKVSKASVYASLAKSTQRTKTKGTYGKGAHSFTILALIDPDKVQAASPWAGRFVDYLKKKL